MKRKEVQSPNQAELYYPDIISSEVKKIGRNKVDPDNGKSRIMKFTISLDEAFSKYGSLENLWSIVENELLRGKKTMAAMLLHENTKANVHIIFKFPKKKYLEDVAYKLLNYSFDKSGEIQIDTSKLEYLSQNLYDEYSRLRDCGSVSLDTRYDTILVHISPNMAKYLFNYEQIMTYTQYKNY